jgi:site-specific DNA recombinase
LRAVLYPRVSSDIQRGNYSIPSQIKDMVAYARERGYTLVGDRFVDPITGQDCEKVQGAIPAYVDDYTSTESSRPVLDDCLEFLKAVGFDVLIAHSVDRMARDPYIRQSIELQIASYGARVEYVLGNYDKSPDGEVRKDIDATFAKWENAKRVERSNRGKKRKAEMGKFVSGTSPYGYRIDPEAPSGLTVYEPEANIVQLIFKWYVEDHLPVRQIARELDKMGVTTYHGLTSWAPSTIADMLKSTVYAGYFYYNKHKRDGRKQIKRDKSEWIKIECTPIIPQEVFDATSEMLKNNKDRVRKRPGRFYLLAGMVLCSECDRPYLAQTTIPSNHKYIHQVYRHRISQGHCSNKSITATKLEPMVWGKVVEILLDPKSLRRGYEAMMREEESKKGRQITHLETIYAGI